MPLTFNAIFIGNIGVAIDTIENDLTGYPNQTAENASALVGATFGAQGNPLATKWVSFTSQDTGGQTGMLDMNNAFVNDKAVIDNGTGPVTYTFDGCALYTGTVTYLDGTTATNVPLVVAQMTNGDLYLMPSATTGTATNTALAAGPILSVKLTAMTQNVYAGLTADRAVLNFVTCFLRGTRLATPSGQRRIEDLRPGDLVQTVDAGPQPVLLVTRRKVSIAQMQDRAELRPIRIARGALGALGPDRALFLSQQHRVALPDSEAVPGDDAAEVLVPARALRRMKGISMVKPKGPVEYFHILLPRHHLVLAEGLATESFYTGPMALRSLGPAEAMRLVGRFGGSVLAGQTVRPVAPKGTALPGAGRAPGLRRREAQG